MAQGTSYPGGLADVVARRLSKVSDDYRNFIAIEYSLSGKIAFLLVAGDVLVANPGIEASLSFAVPQGINPEILLLRLNLIQRHGVWPDVETWVSAKYFSATKPGQYSDVTIVNQQLGDHTVRVVQLP